MRKVFIVVTILAFSLLLNNISFCAFDNADIGARPSGMGGAFVAIADDSNASAYNPAGLGFVKDPEASFTHLILYSGVVNYDYAGMAIPLGSFGSIGMSFGILQEESKIYSEKNVAFSYSKSFANMFSAGANIKMLNTGFDLNKMNKELSELGLGKNPYFTKGSTFGITVDLGLLVKPISELGIGLVAENLAPVNVSISESDEDKVPMSLKFGVAYKLSAIAKSAQQPALKEALETTIVSLEGGSRKEREVSTTKFKAGIEMWFANQTVGLRAGYSIKKVERSSNSVNLGASLRIPISDFNMRVDYAAQILGSDLQEKLNHRISLAISM